MSKSIRVTSLFFAIYRDLVGADELEVELPAGSTVSELAASIKSKDGVSVLPGGVVVAVNMEYASAETVLRNGDEVAFIPPVAGG